MLFSWVQKSESRKGGRLWSILILVLALLLSTSPVWANASDGFSPAPRLSLIRAKVLRVSRDSDAALTVVNTSVGRYFVPTSETVPTQDPSLWLHVEASQKLESLLVTAAGQQAVLLVCENTPGLILGCLLDSGVSQVMSFRMFRK